ncbi:MAG TPA: hypothetical protein VKE74_29050 [Gemmataceae bacterium]|nr:hypothetical protein [Gemmataceae bacterium]
MEPAFDPTQLKPLDHDLAEAWGRAGVELGVAVVAPFELPVGDQVFRYGALARGFGTAAGVLIRADVGPFHPDSCGAIWEAARQAGYTAANVAPLLCRYDRDEFVLFLNLFGWFGPARERPSWHVGPTLTDLHQQAEPSAAADRGGMS